MVFLWIWFWHCSSFMFSRSFHSIWFHHFNIVRPKRFFLIVSVSGYLILCMRTVDSHSPISWSRSTRAHNPVLISFLHCSLDFTPKNLLTVFSSSKCTLILGWYSLISWRHRLRNACTLCYNLRLLPWRVQPHVLLIMSFLQLINPSSFVLLDKDKWLGNLASRQGHLVAVPFLC